MRLTEIHSILQKTMNTRKHIAHLLLESEIFDVTHLLNDDEKRRLLIFCCHESDSNQSVLSIQNALASSLSVHRLVSVSILFSLKPMYSFILFAAVHVLTSSPTATGQHCCTLSIY